MTLPMAKDLLGIMCLPSGKGRKGGRGDRTESPAGARPARSRCPASVNAGWRRRIRTWPAVAVLVQYVRPSAGQCEHRCHAPWKPPLRNWCRYLSRPDKAASAPTVAPSNTTILGSFRDGIITPPAVENCLLSSSARHTPGPSLRCFLGDFLFSRAARRGAFFQVPPLPKSMSFCNRLVTRRR